MRHPTVSRDGKLLAFTIRSSKHVGNVDVHDWNSGAYESTFMAVGTWYKVLSINLKTGEQQAVYHDDALLPDVMKKRGLGPVFSPTEDLLVYADSYRIYVCDAMTGENRHTWEVPSADMGGWTGQLLVSEYSGLAFAPDGQYVAYLSQGQADIAVRPHVVAFVDVHSGQGSSITLPQEADLSGATPRGLIALDFSPDGRYLVFSASAEGAGGTVGPFLCVLDLSTGAVQAVDAVGVGAHSPVWKGR